MQGDFDLRPVSASAYEAALKLVHYRQREEPMTDLLQDIEKMRALAGPRPLERESWPNEPIGGGNPYWRCKACKRSDPEISSRGHYDWCPWERALEGRRQVHAALDRLEAAVTASLAPPPAPEDVCPAIPEMMKLRRHCFCLNGNTVCCGCAKVKP